MNMQAPNEGLCRPRLGAAPRTRSRAPYHRSLLPHTGPPVHYPSPLPQSIEWGPYDPRHSFDHSLPFMTWSFHPCADQPLLQLALH